MLFLADLPQSEVVSGDALDKSKSTVYFDNLTRKCILQTNEQSSDANAVDKTMSDDAASTCVLSENGESAANTCAEIFVGQRVYDFNGKFLGELENAEFTPKFVLKKLWVSDREFARGQIFSVGDAVIIRAKTPRQLALQQAKALRAAQSQNKEKSATAQAQQTSKGATAPTAALPLSQPTLEKNQVWGVSRGIRKKYGDFNFLLGKTVDKTIVNFQGEVMIKKKERVTKEVLRQAKISGKLIELYLHVE